MGDAFFGAMTRMHMQRAEERIADPATHDSACVELVMATRSAAQDLLLSTTLPSSPRTREQIEALKADLGAASELLARIQSDLERAS